MCRWLGGWFTQLHRWRYRRRRVRRRGPGFGNGGLHPRPRHRWVYILRGSLLCSEPRFPGAPAIGPAIGGYMTETIGWRYLFILVAGLGAVASVGGALLYHETYAPVIRRRIMQETMATGEASESQLHLPKARGNRLNYFFTNLQRPFMLLTRSIVCFILSAYMALWVLSKSFLRALLILVARMVRLYSLYFAYPRLPDDL